MNLTVEKYHGLGKDYLDCILSQVLIYQMNL
jgi:hypothetical protein